MSTDRKVYMKEWRAKNREKIKLRKKAYREKNAAKIYARRKRWRDKRQAEMPPEQLLAERSRLNEKAKRRWKEMPPEQRKEHNARRREYYHATKDRQRAYLRQYYHANKEKHGVGPNAAPKQRELKRARCSRYRETHREEIRAGNKVYRDNLGPAARRRDFIKGVLWYEENGAAELARRKLGRQQKLLMATRIKQESGCVVCGYDTSAKALHFHHTDPAAKWMNVSTLIGSACSPKSMLAETEKCEVLCANCHYEVHAGVTELPREKR